MDWEAWQTSWDSQQQLYLPDREERFRVMLDIVEFAVGASPRVLDLACGTASISRRLFHRLPAAESIAVDMDPTLLAIARGSFHGDPRISFLALDVTEPDWTQHLPAEPFDAVLTATALHWLQPDALARLYMDLAKLVRPGGVFVNADHMPDPGMPHLNAIDDAIQRTHRTRARAAGALDWDQWWAAVADEPALAEEYTASRAILDTHSTGVTHPPAWHTAKLAEAGFLEAGIAWRSITDAMVVAVG